MKEGAGYRGEAERVQLLPPRAIRWKLLPSALPLLSLHVFVGFHVLVVVGWILSLPLHLAELAYGEVRSAQVTATAITTTPRGARSYDISFTHEVNGQLVTGLRTESLRSLAEPPPEIAVHVGEPVTVSCFVLGGYHHDDLALPRESAFHRRATSLVLHVLGLVLVVPYAGFVWFLTLRPWYRERALLREGVLVQGTVTSLLHVGRGRRHGKRVVAYTFEGPDGEPRNGTCEARDFAGWARLVVGDAVNVTYDPADWRHNYVYEVGASVLAGDQQHLPAPALPRPTIPR